MAFFNRKEQKPNIVFTDYSNWEKDLGFLTLVMDRKKNITKNYYIGIFSTQLKETDYLRDEDLEGIIYSGVSEVIQELSDSYKNFLITKYFASEGELIKFVTEEFYVELTSEAIKQNNSKIRTNIIKKKVDNIARPEAEDSES
jgi:hypothetical protein